MILLRVLRNFAALMASTVLERAITFVLILFVARILGSAGLGEYSLAFAFLTIFGTLSNLGQNFLIVREVARERGQTGRYFSNSLLLVGMAALVCSAAMMVTVRVLGYPDETVAGVSIMALALVPNSLASVPEAIFQGWERMEFITLLRFVCNLLGAGASIGLLLHGAPLTIVFWVLAAQRTLLLLLYICFLCLRIPEISWQPEKTFMGELARLSLVFTAISVVVAMIHNVDMLLLLRIHGSELTGFYAAAAKPIRLISLGAPMLMMAIYPSLSSHFGTATDRFSRIIETSLRAMALLIPFASLMIVLAAEPLIRLVYGSGYESSVLLLQVLAFTLVPVFGAAVLFRGLLASNRERVSLRVVAVNLAVNVSLNLMLTPAYGGLGAAIAALAAAIAGFAQAYLILSRLIPIDLWRISFKPLMSCAVAGTVYLVVGGPAPLRLLLAVLVYSLGLLISGALSTRQLQAIRTLWEDMCRVITSARTQ